MHSLVHASFFLIAVVALAADLSNGQRTSEAEAQSLAVAPGQGTFLVLSDIHFNPLANPKLVPELGSADAMRWRHIPIDTTRVRSGTVVEGRVCFRI